MTDESVLTYRQKRLLGKFEPRFAPLLLLLAPLVGTLAIIVTRWLASVYHPELWHGTIPSLSKVGAYAPNSYVYAGGMTVVGLIGIAFWMLMSVMNRHRIEVYARTARERWVSNVSMTLTVTFGISASIFLSASTIITLEVNDPTHMLLSKLFFSSQVLAFIFDTFTTWHLGKVSAVRHGGRSAVTLGMKPWFTLFVFMVILFFLFMFIYKETGLFSDPMLVRRLYTGAEMVFAIACLIYPIVCYREIRDYFGSPFMPGRNSEVIGDVAGEAEG